MFADERCRTIHLDHGEPSAGGRNGVAFSCVSLFSNPQCVQLRLEGAPIDYVGGSRFISHEVFHRFLRYIASVRRHARRGTVAQLLREERRLLEGYELAACERSQQSHRQQLAADQREDSLSSDHDPRE
jgi:hypothetical protein